MTESAITGLFTLAGSALTGTLAYLQGRISRQTERMKELAKRRTNLRQERKDAYLGVLTAMTHSQEEFVTLQANPNWPQLPEAERLAEVRNVRHSLQQAVFAAILVAREETIVALAGLNQEVFARGDELVANPTSPPEATDVAPILLALHHDLLKDMPD